MQYTSQRPFSYCQVVENLMRSWTRLSTAIFFCTGFFESLLIWSRYKNVKSRYDRTVSCISLHLFRTRLPNLESQLCLFSDCLESAFHWYIQIKQEALLLFLHSKPVRYRSSNHSAEGAFWRNTLLPRQFCALWPASPSGTSQPNVTIFGLFSCFWLWFPKMFAVKKLEMICNDATKNYLEPANGFSTLPGSSEKFAFTSNIAYPDSGTKLY